ncbi:MAG: glycosyltransferase [Deltaproteobacteria bacterium]|nr:glycosyltransferase [Deltaproteobacteria bacterium]
MDYPPGLPALLRSRKRLGPPRRVWFFRQKFFLEEECIRACRKLGLEVREWELGEGWDAAGFSGFLSALLEFQPDFFFCINHIGFDKAGRITELLRGCKIPAAVWYVDNPDFIIRAYPQNVSPWVYLFVWDRHYLDDLKAMGFSHLTYLPLAADPRLFRPFRTPPSWKFGEIDAAFVGSTWTQRVRQQLARFREEPEKLAIIDTAARRFISSPAYKAREELAAVYPGFSGLSLQEQIDLEAAALWRASQMHRLESVIPLTAVGLQVYGDEAWEEFLPAREAYGGRIGYNRELPAFYQCVGVNLNVTSLQMKDGLNQRVFDVPAAGGFLLTDLKESLLDLFQEDEVAVYHDPEEARAKLLYYGQHPAERRTLANRARERVLAQHTFVHRVQAVLENLSAAFF